MENPAVVSCSLFQLGNRSAERSSTLLNLGRDEKDSNLGPKDCIFKLYSLKDNSSAVLAWE